ncbi:hypothetical protein N9M53_02235 [Alphaproteobacteria bacterium]|nr:hypothetical protein [Alphaproteobacteria bacterium]
MLENHSRPLDVHRWSDHPESNKFVNLIYDEWFADYTPGITKKHLKVILLDMYVGWKTNPDITIGIAQSQTFYRANSRYNALHISSKTIPITKRLLEVGLLDWNVGKPGYNNQPGIMSQFWPTKKLKDLFKQARFGLGDIITHPDKETIILRNASKKEIPYEDTPDIMRMRELVRDYNRLLERTFVDIPKLNEPVIVIPKKKSYGKPTRIFISQNEKFTRRIFSNSSWEQNGRFNGGWWQRIPSEYREDIYINDEPSIEIDYSALHPILVYQRKGIDYWKDIKKDPYQTNINGLSDKESRAIGKCVLLFSFNMTDETKLFQAVKSELQQEIPQYRFTFDNLRQVLSKLREMHPIIEEDILSGIGLNLMNIDGKIAEHILARFVGSDIPILAIHDSFIVPVRQDGFLRTCMKDAIDAVLSDYQVNTKQIGLGYQQWQSVRHTDYSYYLSLSDKIKGTKDIRSEGYQFRKQMFKEYLKEQ